MSDQVEEKKLKRTDLKPIKYDFIGTSDELLDKFYQKIKPIVGVVKYQMDNWEQFPTNLDLAKELAKDWAKKFTTNTKFSGLVVNIYWHLEKKTVRFELKKYIQSEIKKFQLVKSNSSDEYKNQIFSQLTNTKGVYIFDSGCWENLELETCKELGKAWSNELELMKNFAGLKVIMFFNPSKKNIKVTVK